MELRFTNHPVIKSPTDEEIILLAKNDPELLSDLHIAHEGRIRLSRENPLEHGFELESWISADDMFSKHDTLFVSGGNRSGKTEYGGRVVVKAALENPSSEIVCFAQDADASVRLQQASVYKYLPPEYKKKTKSNLEYLNYSTQNGFTKQQFILPNGSKVFFHTYSQFTSNKSKFEGYECGSRDPGWVNVGVWLDEYLEDGSLVDTFKFRLLDRNSKMLLTFTPKDGYTPFVSTFMKGAQTLKTKKADLLSGREVPFIQYSPSREAGIVYFHSKLNPFGGYKRMTKELKNSSEEEILVRAYGYPVKSITSLLPMFSTEVNVLGSNPNKYGWRWPQLTKENCTWYHILDPAGKRNSVCIWAAVTKTGDIFIRREWPDKKTYGEWAEFGDPRCKYGPSAKKFGYSVGQYVELFKDIEKDLGISVFERIADSRYFSKENEDNVDLFTRYHDEGLYFYPSCGKVEAEGIAALDEWFDYKPGNGVDESNKPRCYIHESCGNLIDSLINYNSNGKKDEAFKDFFDVIRYFRMHNNGDGPDYVGKEGLRVVKVGAGGY